jgi:uncharacterized membrane protein YccC
MNYRPETPFDSIEDTHQYVELLLEAIAEARQEVETDITAAVRNHAERREQALRLVAHNLGRLEFHIARSRRILNDLRTLRRLLLEERAAVEAEQAKAARTD